MAGFARVNEKRRRARAGEGGGDFVADVTTFAHPGDDDASLCVRISSQAWLNC